MAWNRKRRRPSSGSWAFVAHNPTLVIFFSAALVLLIIGRGQDDLFDDARGAANDAGAVILDAVSVPVAIVKRWGEGLGSIMSTYDENQKLRHENAKLRAAQSELTELQRKVQRYEGLLKVPADAPITAVAARVIADTTGPFVRTVLVNAGRLQDVAKGQAVVDDRGLLGRVIATGNRSSRVLLVTDLNSRIPVMIEGANLKAILTGDNTERPTLEYLPSGSRIAAGARIVTTSDGAIFPPGIAIGTVAKGESSPRVTLFTNEGRADFVRILKYRAPIDVDEAPSGTEPADKGDGKATPASAEPGRIVPPQTNAGHLQPGRPRPL